MKEKSAIVGFPKLKGKEKSNFSKIIGGGWLLYGKFRSPLSKLMITHSASCWICIHGVVER